MFKNSIGKIFLKIKIYTLIQKMIPLNYHSRSVWQCVYQQSSALWMYVQNMLCSGTVFTLEKCVAGQSVQGGFNFLVKY